MCFCHQVPFLWEFVAPYSCSAFVTVSVGLVHSIPSLVSISIFGYVSIAGQGYYFSPRYFTGSIPILRKTFFQIYFSLTLKKKDEQGGRRFGFDFWGRQPSQITLCCSAIDFPKNLHFSVEKLRRISLFVFSYSGITSVPRYLLFLKD